MKKHSPNRISLITASSVIIYFFITTFFISFTFPLLTNWERLILETIILFVLSFFLFRYNLEIFVNKKIKLIYKIIHNLKLKKDTNTDTLKMDEDFLNKVYVDVETWAKHNKEEIEGLKNMEQYRKEFLGNVSHELKTPIFNIQGYILTLLEGGLEDERINRDYLLRAEKSVERMISIVEDLDIVSKLESGQLEMNLTRFDIIELIKEVFESLEIKANDKRISFKLKKDTEKQIFVKADKDRIRQVLTNLVFNSIKYGKQNGTTLIRTYDIEENLLIEVADDGIGIPEKNLSRLFERFYRVDKSRSRDFGGSGLGLAIVKHIIEAHQQTINVRSTEGIGSTFSFTLLRSK